MPTRLEIAATDIKAWFDQLPQRVFSRSEIDAAIRDNRTFWRLAQSTTNRKFIEFLRSRLDLKEHVIELPNRPTIRFSWNATALEIIQTLRPNGYFSHLTAVFLHGLTDQIPKTIYYNFEQPASGGGGTLTQEGIDRAFHNRCRVTNNSTVFEGHTLIGINGKNTKELGVAEFSSSAGHNLRVTNVERTLIDIVVRPVYAGGIPEVATAYELAAEHVSLNRIVAYLRKLRYVYPYHQCIGYLLARSGRYTYEELAALRSLGMDFDFYLDYQMKETDYISEWRLFVPKGF